MKSIKLIAIMATMMIGGMAQADYLCKAFDGNPAMEVHEKAYTRLGTDTMVVLDTQETKILHGNLVLDEGSLLKKKVIEFYNPDDSLTIIQQPKVCGRGSCDYDSSPTITAKLVVSDKTTMFSCYETSL
ncbi:MAG: hypothetical protein H6625_12465 [Bdellovibrionaceae bacterium]|nr:hypothetical protein [Pseudobdellovibrionaceae bacterium]